MGIKSGGKKKNIIFWMDLWRLIEPSRSKIKKLSGIIILVELVKLVGPFLLKNIIDNLTSFNPEKVGLIFLLIFGMLVSEQIGSLINWAKDRMIFDILIAIEYYLPLKAQKKLMFLPLFYHEKEDTGSKIVKIERGVSRIIELLGNISWEVAPTIMQLLATITILFVVDWRFGIVFSIFAPMFIWITFKVNRDLHPMRKERHKAYEKASGKIGQSIININTVKTFVQEKREVRELEEMKGKIQESETMEWRKMLRYGLGRNLVLDLGRISMLIFGVYFAWKGMISIGTLVFVITLSEKSFLSLFRLSRFYDRMEQGAEAVTRFVKLIDEKAQIKNPSDGIAPRKLLAKSSLRMLVFPMTEIIEHWIG